MGKLNLKATALVSFALPHNPEKQSCKHTGRQFKVVKFTAMFPIVFIQ